MAEDIVFTWFVYIIILCAGFKWKMYDKEIK